MAKYDLYTCIIMSNSSNNSIQEAFEIVSKIIFDNACQLVVGGNPAFESEKVLFHIEMVMTEWGYRSSLVCQYCDSIKKDNDQMRELGIYE